MKDKIKLLGDHCDNAKTVSPKDCLLQCLEQDIGKRDAFIEGKNILIIGLDADGEKYDISFRQAGMNLSEVISVLDCTKSIVKEMMGFNS